MAEARQKEIKVSITVVATKTFTAGFVPAGEVAMLQTSARTAYQVNLEDSTGEWPKCGQMTASAEAKLLHITSVGHYPTVGSVLLTEPVALAGPTYVCVIRSCQQRESSSRKTQAYPIPSETAER